MKDDKAKLMTSIIVDDEADARDRMACLLEKCEHINNLESISHPADALEKIKEHKPDLLFVDVEMPQMSGFDLVRQIHAEKLNSHIVFVTGFSQYAIKAIKAGAYDFLLKPVDIDELREVVLRLSNFKRPEDFVSGVNGQKKNNQVQRLKLPTHTGYVLVEPDDVLYCEADGSYTVIYLKDGREITESSCLSKVEKRFISYNFIRISRFHLVNLMAIKEVDRKRNEVLLSAQINQVALRVSRKYFSNLNQWIAR